MAMEARDLSRLSHRREKMPEREWTAKQGQYLAFIYNYTVIHGRPPAETDMQRFFGTSPPAVHQMVVRLDEKGLIAREPGEARTIRVLVSPDELPLLRDRRKGKKVTGKPRGVPIYQIKVTLRGSKPPIWRRIQVEADTTLAELHTILQAVMGWWDYHLHQFIIGETYYGVPHPDYMVELLDESGVPLNEIADAGSKFVYEYDFGDGWQHVLEVEKVVEPERGQGYPVCVKGRRATPPEDFGGIPMYNYFMEALRNPEHPEYPGAPELLERLGDEFDPAAFDLEEVNAALRELE
jgi:hypothetical protein